jgi:hypothetical protein
MHDPVTPMLVQPALIGWEAKQRRVEVVNRFGRLKVLDDRELVIELEKMEDFENLERALSEAFGQEVTIEIRGKK